MYSLRLRLFIIASFILVIFFIATALILENAYKKSTLAIQFARLENDLQDLVSIADPYTAKDRIIINDEADHRLRRPFSGLYAQVTDYAGDVIWTSFSGLDLNLSFVRNLKTGKKKFYQLELNKGEWLFAMSYAVKWPLHKNNKPFIFSVAENKYYFNKQLHEFSVALWDWFFCLIILLLLVLIFILNWGLYPISKLTTEIKEVERGNRDYLLNNYPKELVYLKSNINHFIEHESKRRARYVNAVADLAHSMKTPLAILRNIKRGFITDLEVQSSIEEQLDRLEQILRYQLQRAATSGSAFFPRPINISKVIDKILKAMQKVYIEKRVLVFKEINEEVIFYGDEVDLLEILGNCLDNAFKWCCCKVWVKVKNISIEQSKWLKVCIEDDGKGFALNEIHNFKKRGIRADEKQAGDGLGLAMVNDIIKIYGGQLFLENNKVNGARVTILFKRSEV